MDKFFSPHSVAIVGASANPQKTGYSVLKNIIQGNFPGKIYPINPKETEIQGHPSFKSLDQTPTPADLAIIVIPAPYVPDVVRQGAEAGVTTFVIITAGFGEIGKAGAPLDHELQEIIQQYDIKIMGPNCLGVIAPHTKLNAAFGGDLPAAGNVAIVSQSGAIVSSLCDWSGLRHFGFSKVVSLGNTLQTNENDYLEYLEKDPQTEVIILFLKHLKDKEKFLTLTTHITKTKTIILYKAGGQKSVTPQLEEEIKNAGIILTTSLTELYDLAHLCSTLPLPNGNQTTIITNAGGPGVIAHDAVTDSPAIEFAKFTPQVKQELITALPAEALPINPIDLIGDAKSDLYEKSLDIILRNNATDSLVVILSPQAMTQPLESAQAIIYAKNKYPSIPIITCFLGGTSVKAATDLLLQNGIPCYLGPTQTIWALEKLNFLRHTRKQ